MFHINLFLAFIYVACRFVAPLPWSVTSRVLLGLALLLISKYHLIQIWVFGTMFSPELPHVLVLIMGWLFCACALLLVLTLLLDLCFALCWIARRGRALSAISRTRARYIAGATALSLSAAGVGLAVQVPEVRKVELTVRGLPPALAGFRIVQLSDLHISRLLQEDWARGVVERTNALQADLIVITGDLIDGTPQARQKDVQPLAGLQARHGVIASLGNHEYYFGAAQWTAKLEELGMRVLVNQHATISERGSDLLIAGVTDPVALRYGMDGPDLALALKGAPADRPVVLLSHRPIDMVQNAEAGVDLQLSGHTHGGMVYGLKSVVRKANGGYVSGLYKIGGLQLYVSNGTGLWNGFPMRLGVPAEITEFVLRPGAD